MPAVEASSKTTILSTRIPSDLSGRLPGDKMQIWKYVIGVKSENIFMREVVIVGMARTPFGNFQGTLSSLSAPKLGAIAIEAALKRAGVSADQVSEVIMGNVLSAGVGQAPARQAAIFASVPKSVPALTINKVCKDRSLA